MGHLRVKNDNKGQKITTIEEQITISFWVYGDADIADDAILTVLGARGTLVIQVPFGLLPSQIHFDIIVLLSWKKLVQPRI